MAMESYGTDSQESPEGCSVLVTVTTPGSDTPICRLGNARDVLGRLTVRQLIERVVSPKSLLSIGVPMAQLQAESATALAVSELLSSQSAEVYLAANNGDPERQIGLDESASAIAQTQTGEQGSTFVNISLDVRPVHDVAAPAGLERRQLDAPRTVEVEAPSLEFSLGAHPLLQKTPSVPEVQAETVEEKPRRPLGESFVLTANLAPSPDEEPSVGPGPGLAPAPPEAAPRAVDEPATWKGTPPEVTPTEAEPWPATAPESGSEDLAEQEEDAEDEGVPAEVAAVGQGKAEPGRIVAIVAEAPPAPKPAAAVRDRKEYLRKSDWLRAQFLPEVEALDFSGLFVGNLGAGVRDERTRRNVVLADPARITDILLQGNSYRRSGDHAKALICYQELVDIDPANADFRFLLGKTFVELGQLDQAAQAFTRAKELGHEGAQKELSALGKAHRPKKSFFSFLRFWR